MNERAVTSSEVELMIRRWIEGMPIARTLGVRCGRAALGEAELAIPFASGIGFGRDEVFPASVVGALIDFSGGAAVASASGGTPGTTVDFDVRMLAPAAGPCLVAVARVVRPAPRRMVAAVEVFAGAEETPCAIGSVQMRVRPLDAR